MISPKEKDIPLYNSRIIDTYLKLLRSKYSYVNISEILNYAGMKPYEVADQGHWFTQKQVDLFYERLLQVTKNDKIALEAGRYAASPEALGVMRQYALSLVGPNNAFKLIKKISENLTKSSLYESKILSPNKIEITVTPRQDISERHFQCENRIGFFEAFVTMFKNTAPVIEHSECIFAGGSICRYIVSWKNTPSEFWFKIRKLAVIVLFIFFLTCFRYSPVFALEAVLPFSTIVVLLLSLCILSKEKSEFENSLQSLRDSSDKLLDQININYKNALLTNDIGQTLSKQTNSFDTLANAIQILEKHLDYDRGMILLANTERTRLIFRTGFGYNDDEMRLLIKTGFHLDRPESKGAFVVCFREQKPLLVDDLNAEEGNLSLRSQALAKKLGSQSFICCPIIYEEEVLGILAVDNKKSKRPLIQSDLTMLMGIAPMIGISIRNATLIESKTKQFRSILQVLAASIDARDSLTAGHSEKVTEYALGICDELGLPDDYRETIRVASLLHDYGKIGIPDSILKKEGKLTPEEFEIVKSHSYKTQEILQQISFEGNLVKVPEIAGAHHEKIDGSGYPNGLTGKDIPLGAKIIAVADFFEAITAKRHYREPMPVEFAFDLLQKESEMHFEKKIVNAFISYYNKTNAKKNLQMVS